MASDLGQALDLSPCPFPGRGCCDDPSVEWVGSLNDPSLKAGNCENPAWMFCVRCGAQGVMACGTTRRSRCLSCARKYQGRVAQVFEQGIVHGQEVGAGTVVGLTVTAPGNRQHRMPSGKVCDCTPVGGIDVGEWNATFTARMNRVLEGIRRGEASPLVDGKRQAVPLSYAQAREPQDGKRRADGCGRFALHLHGALYRSDGQALELDVRLLRRLVIRHGFGHELKLKPLSPSAGARYFAKYVADASDVRDSVPFGRDGLGRRRKATYRTWTASRNWAVTMKAVRAQQAAHWQAMILAAIAGTPQAGPPLDAYKDSYAKGATWKGGTRPDGMDQETWDAIRADELASGGP